MFILVYSINQFPTMLEKARKKQIMPVLRLLAVIFHGGCLKCNDGSMMHSENLL